MLPTVDAPQWRDIRTFLSEENEPWILKGGSAWTHNKLLCVRFCWKLMGRSQKEFGDMGISGWYIAQMSEYAASGIAKQRLGDILLLLPEEPRSANVLIK